MKLSKINVQPVILNGGLGTRLWPLSRSSFPKQFHCLNGNQSLFQQSVQRLTGLTCSNFSVAPPLIVAGEEHRFLVNEQLLKLGLSIGEVLLEPVSRNTAPALTLAALAATQDGQDPILVVTPSDQAVNNSDSFTASILNGINAATDGSIVILGITPTHPESGYGYIKTESISSAFNLEEKKLQIQQDSIHVVKGFVEKPTLEMAEKFQNDGDYYWNAGIFIFKASVWLKALEQFRLDILRTTVAAWEAKTQDGGWTRPGKLEFSAVPAESVDYAVIENCPGSVFPLKMIHFDGLWSDLGAWRAVWNVQAKDHHGNALVGDVISHKSANTLVYASNRLVALVGVQDLVVIETADAVLVANKKNSQDVKQITSQLSEKKRHELNTHCKVHRPWGWYETIDEGRQFKVKRILVNPFSSLSLQKHQHRAEHWIVVSGIAEIINESQMLTLAENQSTYIPKGAIHRLTNPSHTSLEIIEVQSGSYLGEDDIIRLDDTYGRL